MGKLTMDDEPKLTQTEIIYLILAFVSLVVLAFLLYWTGALDWIAWAACHYTRMCF